MYTVWFCVPGEALMYCSSTFSSIEEAQQITKENFENLLWLKDRTDYWIEILDKNFKKVQTTRRVIQQIGLFK
tara:strand:- start:566 stop:784 length:219 start_codon:yes stop_codon:yes gene_type:complete